MDDFWLFDETEYDRCDECGDEVPVAAIHMRGLAGLCPECSCLKRPGAAVPPHVSPFDPAYLYGSRD